MSTIEETQASNRLSDRLRNGLALAQTRIHTMEERAKSQWTDLPAQLRTALDRAFARIRTTLDLPSRADVSDLMDRIEALDRKIGALEKRQGKRAGSRAADAGAVESIADAELEAAESTDTQAAESTGTQAAAARSEASAGDEAGAGEASDAGEGASKDTSRKTLPSTSAGKTLKASDATTRPAKNGESKNKPGKQRPKNQRGRGGKS
jgi:hypothetical protein